MVVNYEKEPASPQVKEELESELFGCTLRVHRLRGRVFECRPSIDLERAKIVTESFMKTEGDPVVMRHAKAFTELCQRKIIVINDGELIVGSPGSKIRGGSLSPDTYCDLLGSELETISTRPQDPFLITEDDKKLFREFIGPYWKGRSFEDAWQARRPDDICQLSGCRGVIFPDIETREGGQFAPDYRWLINSGLDDIRKRIKEKLASLDIGHGDYDKIVFLKALLIVCDGIDTLARRYVQLAKEKASGEKSPEKKVELMKIADICQWVPTNPARTFWEALQSFWFYHVCLQMKQNKATILPGRMDQYLYPHYKKDIEEGRITKEQAQELLECLWVKFAEVVFLSSESSTQYFAGYNPFQQVCCGGVTKNGQDAVNELSYMILQATMDVRLVQPSLSVKYHKGKNPDSFLHKVAELVALGTGFPAIFNDKVGIRMMLEQGIPLEEACDWHSGGCVVPSLAGKYRYMNEGGEVNCGSAVELALTNGMHRLTNSRVPVPQTGDPRKFKSFKELFNAG